MNDLPPKDLEKPENLKTGDPVAVSTDSLADANATAEGGVIVPPHETPLDLTGRYLLGAEIARGGMGVVYRATDTAFGREVAVKVLQNKYTAGSSTARRFNEETRISGQLQHPNIPAVFDHGTLPDGRPFLAMKLIKGETLDDLLKFRPDPSQDRGRFVAVFEQVCQAVAYAHAHNVIHRDLKPANVMVGSFGEVQVMDWGLAKVIGMLGDQSADPEATSSETAIQSLRDSDIQFTQAGSVLGTPAYMPPEQALGAIHEVDARSDVFGLGGILAAVLTGRPPFVGDTAETTRVMAARGEIAECFTRLDASGADPEQVSLAKHCLSAKPANRPVNAGEVAKAVAELRAAADERARQAELDLVKSEGEKSAAEEQRKRRRVQWALSGSVLLVLVLGVISVAIASLWQKAESARADAEHQRGIADTGRDEELRLRGLADAARDTALNLKVIADTERNKAEQAQNAEKQAREKLAIFEYGLTMQVAHQEWRENNFAAMRALLDGTNPTLRRWEWNYLDRLCDCSLLSLKGHSVSVTSVSWSADGTRIATASLDKTAKIWDAKTGAVLLTLKGHTTALWSVSWSGDGTRIATGSDDTTAKIWDAKTGAELLTLKGRRGWVLSVSWSGDGTQIATGNGDGTASIWDAKTGAELRTLKGHARCLQAVSWSGDGTRIATGSRDNTAKIWDAKTGTELLTLKGHSGSVNSVSWNGDGTRIATGSGDGTAKLWDTKTGAELLTLKGHIEAVSSVSWNGDGTRIATGSEDSTARIWDVKTGAELLILKGHMSGVSSIVDPGNWTMGRTPLLGVSTVVRRGDANEQESAGAYACV